MICGRASGSAILRQRRRRHPRRKCAAELGYELAAEWIARTWFMCRINIVVIIDNLANGQSDSFRVDLVVDILLFW